MLILIGNWFELMILLDAGLCIACDWMMDLNTCIKFVRYSYWILLCRLCMFCMNVQCVSLYIANVYVFGLSCSDEFVQDLFGLSNVYGAFSLLLQDKGTW